MAPSDYPYGTTFNSRLCDVCKKSLQPAFATIKNRKSDKTPHHVTKESLIDSVLLRSCHLCRFIIFHLKSHWGLFHRAGVEDLKEEPTTLTEDDFKDSDFHLGDYPYGRFVILSYLIGLPENLNFHAYVTEHVDHTDGVFGLVEIGCPALDHAIPRFWIFEERAFGEKPTASRPNNNTCADSSRLMLNEWLERCNKHDTCSTQNQMFLPTRLLDLGEVDAKGQARLVLSENLDKRTRYVTLSHCWGGNVPFQLRADAEINNLNTMMEGFPVDDMPKTFRDAVTVARWADVRYIWIDSCCIIQQDAAEWAKEAKMMRKIYQHTYFNISADHSENSHGGLFNDRLAYKFTPCHVNTPAIGNLFILPQFDLIHPLTQAPISERAWVTQERFLSPRILHFTTDQLFWECAGTFACETFPQGLPHVYDTSTSWHYRKPTSLAQPATNYPQPGPYEVWGRICQDYSRSKLSYLSDKIFAFAGIAGEFQSRFADDIYLAGIWRGDLLNGLLWKATAFEGRPIQPNGSHEYLADPYITATEPETYRAPSWSWLGGDCGIVWQPLARESPRAMIEILDVHVDLVDENNRTGDIRGGYIKLRGHLRDATWSQAGHVESIILDGKTGDQLLVPPDDPSATPEVDTFKIQRDAGTEFPIEDIVCLPIRLSVCRQRISLDSIIEGLVLAPTGNKNEYRRIGHFEAIGEGYCYALFYRLRAPDVEARQPWATLNLKPNPAGIPKEGGGAMASFDYNEGEFDLVKESIVTIV